ncbi:DUF6082 family protein [Phytohabitans sp. ZYX-F-186]|uniref:DUF6082 family protein n=1 Tax=Phytohabitans maris TaxID=3071409 RepID=A0ABU0ZID5_9ACTN|nr:DUF6082 family protein [Phytohabitans sp. ZYX-F-186]MDQ7906810.1 DUF6082 family protein [Phytohabitans sp. ZYX-F-186]
MHVSKAGFTAHSGKIAALLAVLSAAAFVGAVVLPAPHLGLDSGDQDWMAAGIVTLFVAATSTLIQRKQMSHERLWLQREYTTNIVQMAMDDPVYAQCWGPRVTPPDMDERLFYYVNMMLTVWSYAWEQRQIGDQQVRAYIRASFESEVSREYWRIFGAWRSHSRRRRERAFYQMIADEYRRAVESGPPSRSYEPPMNLATPLDPKSSRAKRRRSKSSGWPRQP